RLDHDQSYGTELMPQFSASYNTGHWIFRLSGGRSIRSASYTERYISTNTEEQLAEGRNLGNPHLQAERSWSGEAGIDFLATSHLRLSATGFLRSSTNLIDYLLKNSSQISNNENLKPNTNYLYSKNLNTIQTYGLETNLLFQYKLNSRWKMFSKLGYTFKNGYSSEDKITKYTSNYARHLLNGMLTLQNGPFNISVTGIWKRRKEDHSKDINVFKAPSYMVWNLKAHYRVYKNISLGIEADNLFDENYQDILGAQMPTRWLMGIISLKL